MRQTDFKERGFEPPAIRCLVIPIFTGPCSTSKNYDCYTHRRYHIALRQYGYFDWLSRWSSKVHFRPSKTLNYIYTTAHAKNTSLITVINISQFFFVCVVVKAIISPFLNVNAKAKRLPPRPLDRPFFIPSIVYIHPYTPPPIFSLPNLPIAHFDLHPPAVHINLSYWIASPWNLGHQCQGQMKAQTTTKK